MTGNRQPPPVRPITGAPPYVVPSAGDILPDAQVWDQEAGEPHQWYVRFNTFLGIGPRRTVLQAYKLERVRALVATGQDKGEAERYAATLRQATSRWYAMALKHHWALRAQQYDLYLIDVERGKRLEDIKEMRERHRTAAKILLDKGLRRAIAIKPEELSPVEASRFIQDGAKLEMAALNVPEPGRSQRDDEAGVEMGRTPGGDIDWSKATDEEVETLLRIQEAIRSRAGGSNETETNRGERGTAVSKSPANGRTREQ